MQFTINEDSQNCLFSNINEYQTSTNNNTHTSTAEE